MHVCLCVYVCVCVHDRLPLCPNQSNSYTPSLAHMKEWPIKKVIKGDILQRERERERERGEGAGNKCAREKERERKPTGFLKLFVTEGKQEETKRKFCGGRSLDSHYHAIKEQLLLWVISAVFNRNANLPLSQRLQPCTHWVNSVLLNVQISSVFILTSGYAASGVCVCVCVWLIFRAWSQLSHVSHPSLLPFFLLQSYNPSSSLCPSLLLPWLSSFSVCLSTSISAWSDLCDWGSVTW